ncbi:TRAP transporter large permease subunit [Halomonas nitroreducens]|uniref:TRAP transporter large permease subunit n=1 Tax=Halomonas nitroreducens TaxID=447425 RepID=A0A431V035_9GAMM|nr:TRAP transporter large permease subunit [Halomonas nitroreducens]RTR00475.1 TRAP transporter large permease subunit [Halomonas nitroreducens]
MVTRQSVAALFAATVAPPLLLILGLILVNRLAAGRLFQEVAGVAQSSGQAPSKARVTWQALPALSLPFIILGGIYGGVFTPTEAAAVAAFAAIVIGFLVYRDQSFKHFSRSEIAAAETTGSIILILLFSFMIGRILAFERVPQDLTEMITTLIQNPLLILIAVNLFLVLAGAILDDVSVTMVVAPLFLPLMVDTGVHPVHFGAIVACSVVIGANSPPVAPILYMACRIGRVSIHKTFSPALQLIAFVGIPVMLITTFMPELSLWLPRLLGFI